MTARAPSLVKLALLLLAAGCGPAMNQTTITCPAGRTLLDNVCVGEGIADYVACVRAQGAQLEGRKLQQISAEAGTLGARASTAAEVSENLSRKYSVSDAATLEVIRRCGAVGAAGHAAPPAAIAPLPAAPIAQPHLRLVKGSGPKVFLVHAGKRFWIPDPDTFNAMGQDWNAIQTIDDGALGQIVDLGALPHMTEGTLVKGSGPKVYRLEQRSRRWIPDPATFNAMGLDWNAIKTLPDEAIDAIHEGPQFPSAQR